jgi:hypothetical protein
VLIEFSTDGKLPPLHGFASSYRLRDFFSLACPLAGLAARSIPCRRATNPQYPAASVVAGLSDGLMGYGSLATTAFVVSGLLWGLQVTRASSILVVTVIWADGPLNGTERALRLGCEPSQKAHNEFPMPPATS